MKINLHTVTRKIQRHYPYPWAKDYGVVLGWLYWYVERGFSICVADEKNLVGIILLRPVMKPKHGLEQYRYDNEGSVLFVDFAYAANNEALRSLVIAATQRFGARQTLAFQRQDKQGRIRLHVLRCAHFALHVLKEFNYGTAVRSPA